MNRNTRHAKNQRLYDLQQQKKSGFLKPLANPQNNRKSVHRTGLHQLETDIYRKDNLKVKLTKNQLDDRLKAKKMIDNAWKE